MGYIRHNAILVTGWNVHVDEAHKMALSIFPCAQVTDVTREVINGYKSFLVAPDGSKEGWADSDDGDSRRADFIRRLETTDWYLDWVEVRYGTEGGAAQIVNDAGKETP